MEQTEIKPNNKLYLGMTALLTALTFVVTFFANVPARIILGAGGNINLGDAIIFLAGALLGPVAGAIAGGVGAGLADILSIYGGASPNYMLYTPFTFVIKSLAGFLCGFIFRKEKFLENKKWLRRIVAMAAAALVIVVGYFIAELILTAASDTASSEPIIILALKTIPANLLQTVISGIAAFIILPKIFPIYFRLNKPQGDAGGTTDGDGGDGNTEG